MKNIALLLPYDYQWFSVAAISDVFQAVNDICTEKTNPAPFKMTIIQTPKQISRYGNSFHHLSVRSVGSRLTFDLVLIPAFSTKNMEDTLKRNHLFLPWLKKQFEAGAEIASFCTGAFLFAESGLLNGKLATTHADYCPGFIITYPKVYVKPGRTVTIDERCYTSGGSTSAFHLLVFLVQKFCGNEMAVRISKLFAIDLDRYQQSYFSTFRPVHSHNDDMVKKIQEKLEKNFLNIQTIEEVIKELPASRRNFVRRFKQMTGVPPIEYLQHIRIEKAKKQLEQTNLSISEIIDQTGYTDPKSFRKIFLKLVGVTPLEYRNKFGVK